MDSPADPPLTIVIRTLNTAPTLARVLAALPLGPKDRLIVVDSGSTDRTLELARAAGALIVPIKAAEFTYGRALNLGFAATDHEWVLALSSHTVPVQPGFLDRYRSAIRQRFQSNVAAAVGPMLTSELDRTLPGGITHFELADFTHGFGFGAGNPNSLYRRSLWQMHPFDEQLGGGEDLEWYLWALRKGHSIAAVHAAEVLYISRRPMKAFYTKGRVDYRAATQFITPHSPSLAGLVIRAAKLLLYAALGKTDWHGAKGSLAHGLGNYIEARALRKGGSASR
jgi:glycosyltransferase involved in cell wall biosynthesis